MATRRLWWPTSVPSPTYGWPSSPSRTLQCCRSSGPLQLRFGKRPRSTATRQPVLQAALAWRRCCTARAKGSRFSCRLLASSPPGWQRLASASAADAAAATSRPTASPAARLARRSSSAMHCGLRLRSCEPLAGALASLRATSTLSSMSCRWCKSCCGLAGPIGGQRPLASRHAPSSPAA